MTEIALALVGALNGLFFYLIGRAGAEERRRLLPMIQSSSPAEFVALEAAAAPKPKRQKRDDFVPRVPHGL